MKNYRFSITPHLHYLCNKIVKSKQYYIFWEIIIENKKNCKKLYND